MIGARRRSVPILAIAALAAGALAAAAESSTSRISVVFVEPERFADVKDAAHASKEGAGALLDELARYIRETGERHVPSGGALELRFTDIDLAGEFEPWRGPRFEHTRFMREIYSPRLDFEFRITDTKGQVLREGRRSLADQLYLARSRRVSDERLGYEKDLLREWFRQEFPR